MLIWDLGSQLGYRLGSLMNVQVARDYSNSEWNHCSILLHEHIRSRSRYSKELVSEYMADLS